MIMNLLGHFHVPVMRFDHSYLFISPLSSLVIFPVISLLLSPFFSHLACFYYFCDFWGPNVFH